MIRIQEAKSIRIQADPDPNPGQPLNFFSHKQLKFYMENILKIGNRSENINKKVQNSF